MSFPVELIYQIVPQRYPFLMIDRILAHEYRKRAVCRKSVTLGEEVFTGHFPGKPVYPGVLLVEMSLQTTQVMLTQIDRDNATGSDGHEADRGFLLQIEKFKFQKVVAPGDVLEISSELVQEALGMIKAKVRLVNQEGAEVAAGTVTVGGGA